MAEDMRPHYINEEEFEDLYKLREKQKEEFRDRPVMETFEDEEKEELKRKLIKSKQAMPRMEESVITPLKRISPEIVGNLFDRVRFLEERIAEINDIIGIREKIHVDAVTEIEKDITEKESIESRLSDIDEKRNIKLDISILRKEKRHEDVQFWKDITELKSELRELMEKHESETKITKLFDNIDIADGSKTEGDAE
ncbi:MAG: hypothetical protein ACXABY_03260 [Candidatus Thorarchaeota archaeon]|jgi:hypothetical protein